VARYTYAFIDTPAGRLRYAKRGEGGEPVLLIHGFGGDLDAWLFNIDTLAGAATVYAFDLPGHGQSEKRLDAPDLAGLAAAVEGFMDAVGMESAHLIGHSMGGAVALKLAATARPRVRSLALIASVGLGPEINGGYIRGYVSAPSRRELKPLLEQLFADPALVSRQMVEDVLKYKRLDGVEAVLSALLVGLFSGERQREQFPGALQDPPPILVVHGAEDRIIPAAHAGAFGPAAASHVIEGAGHMVQMEKAARVNELLLGHILRRG
jgi:pyruvate dehydrogenase E2 component (dihydrolipoamide acetyltransferase)